MTRKRLSGFILLLLLFSSLGAICYAHATPSENDPRLSVKIAVLANFPPQYALDKGKPTGFAVDVMNQVAGLANLDPDYVIFQNWPDAQKALQSGAVDIIPNMGVTKRRQEFADFTSPVETFPVSIFVRKAESGINAAQDLPGHKVVVVEVNVGYTLLRDRPDVQLIIAHNPSEAIMFLLSGQADALVFPQPVIDQLARKSGIENKLKAVGKPLKEIVRGIAVRKGRDDLLGRLDAAVQRFVTTETYKRTYVRWYGSPATYWTKRRVFAALGLGLAVFIVGMFVMRYITLSRFSKTLEKRVQKRTAALAASEENFRLLFENASFGIAVHDLVFDERQTPVNYVLTNMNPAFYKILGFEPGSATGRLATEFYGVPEAPFLEQYAAVALGRQPMEKEVDFAAMGKIFKVLAYSHRHRSFVTVFEDITKRKQTETQLRTVTHKLELAQELGRSGWWEYDVVNEKATWPDVSYALFGHDPSDAAFDYKSFQQLIHPEYHDYYDTQFQKLLDEGIAEFLYPIMRPDGETRWIWTRGEAEYDNSGAPVRLFGMLQDITDRKRLEEELRKNTERLLAIFNTVPVGIVMLKDRIILEANPYMKQLFGYELKDVIGKQSRQLYIDDEEWKRVGQKMETGLTKHNLVSFDTRVRHKDGRLKYVLMTCSRLSDETPPTILAALQDITERKNAERSLLYYEKIVSTVDTLLYLVDRDMVFLQVNDALANILGRKREEIIGRSMEQVADADNYSRMKPQIKRCLAGETVSQEMWIDWPNGTKRFFHIIRHPMFDEDGTVYAVAGVGHDMTEIYQANEALTNVNEELKHANEALRAAKQAAESANKAKSIFLSNMSHELRTPLNAILGYTQILKADKTFGEKQQSGIQTIHQAGEHLLMIINDVLDMSKIEAGKLQLVPSKIQLLPFFENIIDFFKYRAREKGLRVAFETDRPLPFAIIADELRLRQVIFNLLSNAVKFTARGYCRLHVEAAAGKESRCRLKITVEDSGVGIPKNQQEEVFDPFKQVGERLQYKEGSGLGLAISKQLVNLMGGKLAVSSPVNTSPTDGEGVGSRFSFTIEAKIVQAERTTHPQNRRKILGYKRTGKTNAPVKVLIVDDKISNRAVLRDTLKPLGFATQETEDGSMVTKICLKTHPDLILMDLRMPNVDGFSAMNQLKHHDELRDIPVVAVTASIAESETLEKRCIQHGFKGFILKPFVSSDLLESIAGLLPITLIYQQADAQEAADLSKMETPPDELVAKLSESLSKGDIEGILEYAEAISGLGNGKYQDYSQLIRTLANDFKFSELERLISSKENADD